MSSPPLIAAGSDLAAMAAAASPADGPVEVPPSRRRPLVRLCAVLGLALTMAAPAQAACRQALAVGLDISGSVDMAEYRQQMDGLADALTRPSVRAALAQMPGAPVRIAVYEWSGPGLVRDLIGWTDLTPGAAGAVAARLRGVRRVSGDTTTALGSAMRHGAAMLATQGSCWRRVLDISGDGKSNTGPRPRDVRQDAGLAGMTVNALVIGADGQRTGDNRQAQIGELSAYFGAEVIHGPDAFVEVALGFDDYADAMEHKLLRELQVLMLGALR